MEQYKHRRKLIQQKLSENDALLLRQPRSKVRNNDVFFPFHPDRDFYYLTGMIEEDAWLLITKTSCILWSRPQDPNYSLWNGPILGETARKHLQVDSWISIEDKTAFDEAISSLSKIYVVDQESHDLSKYNTANGSEIVYPMRIIKDKYEIEAISKACSISAQAHNHLMSVATQYPHECALSGQFIQHISKHGANTLAYPSIVAAHKNACILHYNLNNQAIDRKSLVLVDAGCEHNQYASDITRTFPASGQFSAKQQALYEAVLDTQSEVLSSIKPGVSFKDLNAIAAKRISQHLCDLKIINTDPGHCYAEKLYREYFPHNVGHTMGLDVHDVPHPTLQPGMVITVEPGIYITDHRQYGTAGIRIEDNILITSSGYENLTKDAVKSVHDIHEIMKS